MSELKAVLWDMDGTLIDTEPYWIEAEFELAALHGGTWSHEHGLNLVGNDLLTSGRYFREHSGVDLAPEVIVEELLDRVIERVRKEVPWTPGALDLLADLGRAQLPCALVTMSYRRFVEAAITSLPATTFSVIVTGDEVTHGKPHPEPYTLAMSRLGVSAEECVAIEDSPTGATSAEEAGALVLTVPNHVAIPASPNRVEVASLLSVTASHLVSLVQQRR